MWELAPKYNALIVFAEHRYFGESFPRGPTGAPLTGVKDCLGFASSAQALADYATLIQHIKLENKGAATSPVVAFGGSYGGMLASWFRIKYPNIVDGAIAASAPIWGLPLTSNAADTVNTKVSGSSAVLAHAAAVSGPDGTASHCATNVLAASILTTEIGKTADGRAAIGDAFRTCSPLKSEADVASVVSYFQGPWFDMSEGVRACIKFYIQPAPPPRTHTRCNGMLTCVRLSC